MHLISYDITDDRLRLKASKLLIRYGLLRVQYSVFMGDIKDVALAKLRNGLDKLVQTPQWTPEDTLMILPLHQYTEDNLTFLGKAPERWMEISGELHTLVL